MKIVFTNSTNSGSIDTIDDTRYNISEGKEEDTTDTEEVVDDTSKQEEEDMGTEDTNVLNVGVQILTFMIMVNLIFVLTVSIHGMYEMQMTMG